MIFENINFLGLAGSLLPVIVGAVLVWRHSKVWRRHEEQAGVIALPSWRAQKWLITTFLILAFVSALYVGFGGRGLGASLHWFMLIPVVLVLITPVIVLKPDSIVRINALVKDRRFGRDDVLRVEGDGKIILRDGHTLKLDLGSPDGAKMFAALKREAGELPVESSKT